MLSRIAIALVFALTVSLACRGGEKDYLQYGERPLSSRFEIVYDNAVRSVLSRGWRPDVVLRTVHLPPFDPESVTGIIRSPVGYNAFILKASKRVWEASGFGSIDPHPKNRVRAVRPVFRSRSLKAPVAARIAAVWRRVLTDRRNYAEDTRISTDTSQIDFYLAFAPREKLHANMKGWGPRTENLLLVTDILGAFAAGESSETELLGVLTKAERTLGI
jgi:hypothetical protein